MKFAETDLTGAYLIGVDEVIDVRGSFARLWCEREFAQAGLLAKPVQISVSHNAKKGTIRGLHYQRAPHEETKVVRCICGAIFDVIVDLRSDSPTYLGWRGYTLSARERNALYVPAGFAHGYQTLTDDTEVLYQISEFHVPAYEGGLRFDDPLLRIDWPVGVAAISEKDLNWANFQPSPQK